MRASYNYRHQSIVVHVIDTGIGISSEMQNSVFNQLGKKMRTAEHGDEGIGLGLTISDKIVRACKGSICFESEGAGKGSTFMFSM